jgi:hypothetical protein
MTERESELEAEVARLQKLILQLADRVAICSELLGRCAERRKACWKKDRALPGCGVNDAQENQ